MRQIQNLLNKSSQRDKNEELKKGLDGAGTRRDDSQKKAWYQVYNQSKAQQRTKNTLGYR